MEFACVHAVTNGSLCIVCALATFGSRCGRRANSYPGCVMQKGSIVQVGNCFMIRYYEPVVEGARLTFGASATARHRMFARC